MPQITDRERILQLEDKITELTDKYTKIEHEKKIMELQVKSWVKDPKSRKVQSLVVTSDGGARKTLRDVVETYIMPKVKFQRDTDLFNMQTGSIGWRLVQLCKVSPDNWRNRYYGGATE